MIARDEDEPKKAKTHEMGQDISTLSVDEINARIDLLKSEIVRLEAEAATKSKGRAAAESLFRSREN